MRLSAAAAEKQPSMKEVNEPAESVSQTYNSHLTNATSTINNHHNTWKEPNDRRSINISWVSSSIELAWHYLKKLKNIFYNIDYRSFSQVQLICNLTWVYLITCKSDQYKQNTLNHWLEIMNNLAQLLFISKPEHWGYYIFN